jgi:hypothetical protein
VEKRIATSFVVGYILCNRNATAFQMVLACAQMGSYCTFELSVIKYIITRISANLGPENETSGLQHRVVKCLMVRDL